ncbi:MAG: hypothetical protein KBH07_02665, partial [Flavobacteriales bacterium]|nr:hypothetical protein [Flavobacteriales bacterium]
GSYARLDGLARALGGLADRVPGGGVLRGAEVVLSAHRSAYEQECLLFLEDLRNHLDHGHA